MKMWNLLVFSVCLITTTWAGAAERSCKELPASGDPGDAGHGLNVTIGLSIPDDADMELSFDVGVPCYTWSREAEGDDHEPGPHDHFNAADATAFANGTFRWTEYGPEVTQEEIEARCAAHDRGTTKYATTSDLCEDHHGILIKVLDVSQE